MSTVPSLPATELRNLREYAKTEQPSSGAPRGPGHRPCLLCEYVHFEIGVERSSGRVVAKNEHWVALVPWWAVWPFEIMCPSIPASNLVFTHSDLDHAVLPYRRHIPSLAHLTTEEKVSFAKALADITKRYDNLFSCSFAYSMGIHQRPIPPLEGTAHDDDDDDIAHLHLHFKPPLLRSATVKKFLVGYAFTSFFARYLTTDVVQL